MQRIGLSIFGLSIFIKIIFHPSKNLPFDLLIESGFFAKHEKFIFIEYKNFGICICNDSSTAMFIGYQSHFPEDITRVERIDFSIVSIYIDTPRFYEIRPIIRGVSFGNYRRSHIKPKGFGHHYEIGDFLLGQSLKDIESIFFF